MIVLGVSGGIAAYKSAELARLLLKDGHEVHCILTEHAAQFVSPLTFATLTGRPALTGNFEPSTSGKIQHIALAESERLILVAPATANVIAKIAHGIADDLLSTVILAAQGMVAVCPAMNVQMWDNPATRANLRILEERGIEIIGPASGSLACGYEGMGRMEEPASVMAEVRELLSAAGRLSGKKILITAGPTREFMDPVRFISNPSSGKMGYALAKTALLRGAEVTLVSGPVDLPSPFGAKLIRVTTAGEMLEAVQANFDSCQIFVSAAAVSDWKPKIKQSSKQKKSSASPAIEVEPTVDILREISKKKNGRILIGFAAETEDLEKNAREKLAGKNLNLIVGNLVGKNGAFGSDENEIAVFFPDGRVKKFEKMSKIRAAHKIWEIAGA